MENETDLHMNIYTLFRIQVPATNVTSIDLHKFFMYFFHLYLIKYRKQVCFFFTTEKMSNGELLSTNYITLLLDNLNCLVRVINI